MISLVYVSCRPGGIDILVDALKRQTCKDWELIVIDDYPGRNCNDMELYIRRQGIPITCYDRSKKKCYEDTPFPFSNIFNSGALMAKGDVVVILNDYQWLQPGALDRWDEVYKERRDLLVTGCGMEFSYYGNFVSDRELAEISVFDPPVVDFDRDSRFYRSNATSPDGLFIPGHDLCARTGKTVHFEGFDPRLSRGMELPYELFYAGMPIEFLEKVNGFDERADYSFEFTHRGFMQQAVMNGYGFMVDTSNVCFSVHHRMWNMWNVEGKDDMWHALKGKRDLLRWEDIPWQKRSPNCFNFSKDRRRS
jgi:glycosyltransferase involved in cell wall biosynthesis